MEVALDRLRGVRGRVRRVAVEGCSPGGGMLLWVASDLSDGADECGVPRDAIWRMRMPGVPDRWLRMWKGHESLRDLLEKYSFFDGEGCMYNSAPGPIALGNARAHAARAPAQRVELGALGDRTVTALVSPNTHLRVRALVPCHVPVRDVGVAQASERSGICWWGSMWFATCFNAACRAVLRHHLDRGGAPGGVRSTELRAVLRDGAASDALRRRLYAEYAIGDDPDQAPELDGQNGYAQFSLFCSKAGIPLVTLMAPELEEVATPMDDATGASIAPPRRPRAGEPAFLGVRTYRAAYQPPLRLRHEGREWTLQSALVGSEYCGHQTAISSCCGTLRTWAAYDPDAVRRGIGPFAFRVPGRGAVDDAAWWDTLGRVIPVINRTSASKYCDMNPHNRHPLASVARAYAAERRATVLDLSDSSHNLVNTDWIYSS